MRQPFKVGAASFALIACALMPALAQQQRLAREPDEIRPGLCRVPVCADYDLGDHVFRFYAPARTETIRPIAPGACECRTVRQLADPQGHFVVAVELPDGRVLSNVTLIRRLRRETSFRSTHETTAEQFARADQLQPLEDFAWGEDEFRDFRVLRRTPRINPRATLYFVPRNASFRFRDTTQPIVFMTPLGTVLDSEAFRADGPTVAARVRLTGTVHLQRSFTPRQTPSHRWVSDMEQAAAAIEGRLIPSGP